MMLLKGKNKEYHTLMLISVLISWHQQDQQFYICLCVCACGYWSCHKGGLSHSESVLLQHVNLSMHHVNFLFFEACLSPPPLHLFVSSPIVKVFFITHKLISLTSVTVCCSLSLLTEPETLFYLYILLYSFKTIHPFQCSWYIMKKIARLSCYEYARHVCVINVMNTNGVH